MILKLKEFWLLGALLLLVAFRPWRSTNAALGLEPPKDTLATSLSSDSLLMQPVTVVLPQSAVDTLADRVAKKDSLKGAYKKKLADADKAIAKAEKEYAAKQKQLQKLQENMITLEDIASMQSRQNGKDP